MGKEKREISRSSVFQFNQKIRERITEDKIDHFFEVTELIHELINNREIFDQVESEN